MINLIVTYHCKPGMREKFVEAIKKEGLDQASLNEEGNMGRYHYYYPVDSADDLLLLETWRDEAAQKEHMAAAHFKRLGELKPEYVIETVIEKAE